MVHVDQVFASKRISIVANRSLDFHIVPHFPMVSAQGAQALICISVVCFSVYLFYECLYTAF